MNLKTSYALGKTVAASLKETEWYGKDLAGQVRSKLERVLSIL